MRLYLIFSASILLIWAFVLLFVPASVMLGMDAPMMAHAFAVLSALVHIVLAIGLLIAARQPADNLAACVMAILLFGVKTFFDLYGLLKFPPPHALFCLGDLWLSAGLFVLLLRAMPGVLRARYPGSAAEG